MVGRMAIFIIKPALKIMLDLLQASVTGFRHAFDAKNGTKESNGGENKERTRQTDPDKKKREEKRDQEVRYPHGEYGTAHEDATQSRLKYL